MYINRVFWNIIFPLKSMYSMASQKELNVIKNKIPFLLTSLFNLSFVKFFENMMWNHLFEELLLYKMKIVMIDMFWFDNSGKKPCDKII